jgi:hypothetical protein
LEEFEKLGKPKIEQSLTREEAWSWVWLAYNSLHYMREEFGAHRDSSDIDEARETEFIDVFCEYLKWLGFFHAKVLISRWRVLIELYPKVRAKQFPASAEQILKNIDATKAQLKPIAAANLPRRATAARMVQVRRGIIIPIVFTATSTLTCLSLKPMLGWQPDTAMFVTNIVYSMVAASLAANFVFGLWLLLPTRGMSR